MRASRRKQFWRALRHKLFVVVSLVAYLVATLGFPLPARARKQTSGVPFPCQDHPCGCRTAEQCWKSCYCFTPEQRLAWAREHNVTPPAYAERPAPATGGWRTTPLRLQSKAVAVKSCCQKIATKACCASKSRPVSHKHPAPVKGLALRLTAAQCQGFATHGISGGAVVPAPLSVAWEPGLVPQGWVIAADLAAPRLHFTPPAPPPRPLPRSV